jgi:hypothetical protein
MEFLDQLINYEQLREFLCNGHDYVFNMMMSGQTP